jgi:hypothetical protein
MHGFVVAEHCNHSFRTTAILDADRIHAVIVITT